jgi:hypothetical protein
MSEQPSTPSGAPDPMETVKAASRDAVKTFMSLIYNPVGALPGAFQSLPGQQALAVGVVFMVVWLLCSLVGASLGVSGLGLPYSFSLNDLSFSYKLRGLILMLSIPVGLTLGVYLARIVLRGAGSIALDVFVAGAALLMVGFAALVGGVLGHQVLQLLMLVALTLAVLVIFTSLTRISGIAEGVAAYLTAGAFVVAAIVSLVVMKIVF